MTKNLDMELVAQLNQSWKNFTYCRTHFEKASQDFSNKPSSPDLFHLLIERANNLKEARLAYDSYSAEYHRQKNLKAH